MSDFFFGLTCAVLLVIWLSMPIKLIAQAAAGSTIMRAIGIMILVAFCAMFAPMAAAWFVVLGVVAAVAHLVTVRTVSR